MTASHRSRPVYTAHDIGDVLASVPAMLGFVPQDSLIVASTHGPRTRLGFRMRMDLPGAEHAAQAAEFVVGHLRANDADGGIVVALTSRQDVAEILLDAIVPAMRAVGLDVVVAVRADGERYWVPGEPDRAGVPYEADLTHPAVVAAIAAGQQIVSSREEVERQFAPVTGAERAEAERAADAVFPEVIGHFGGRHDPDALRDKAMRVIGPLLRRGLQDPSRLSAEEAARVAMWSSAAHVRNAIRATITPGNAATMLRFWTDIARRGTEPFAAAAYSLAGFAAWLTGSGVQCRCAAEQALALDSEYRPALELVELLDHGIGPHHWRASPDC